MVLNLSRTMATVGTGFDSCNRDATHLIKETHLTEVRNRILFNAFMDRFISKLNLQDFRTSFPTSNGSLPSPYCYICEENHKHPPCGFTNFMKDPVVYLKIDQKKRVLVQSPKKKVYCFFCKRSIQFENLFLHFINRDLSTVAHYAKYYSNQSYDSLLPEEKNIVEMAQAFIVTAVMLFTFPLFSVPRHHLLALYVYYSNGDNFSILYCTSDEQIDLCNLILRQSATIKPESLSFSRDVLHMQHWDNGGKYLIYGEEFPFLFEEKLGTFDSANNISDIEEIKSLEFQKMRKRRRVDFTEVQPGQFGVLLAEAIKIHYRNDFVRLVLKPRFEQLITVNGSYADIDLDIKNTKQLRTRLINLLSRRIENFSPLELKEFIHDRRINQFNTLINFRTQFYQCPVCEYILEQFNYNWYEVSFQVKKEWTENPAQCSYTVTQERYHLEILTDGVIEALVICTLSASNVYRYVVFEIAETTLDKSLLYSSISDEFTKELIRKPILVQPGRYTNRVFLNLIGQLLELDNFDIKKLAEISIDMVQKYLTSGHLSHLGLLPPVIKRFRKLLT